MSASLCLVDDKHIPLYRIDWVSSVPHFCGEDDCIREGQYEVRLECGQSVWANQKERDLVLQMLDRWCRGSGNEQWP